MLFHMINIQAEYLWTGIFPQTALNAELCSQLI